MKVQQSKIGCISINFPNGVIPLIQRTEFAGYCCVSAFHPKLPDFHIKVFFGGTQWLGRQYNASQEQRWLWIFIYGLILEQHLENNKIFIIRIQIAWLEKKLLNCTVRRMLRLVNCCSNLCVCSLFILKTATSLPILLTGTFTLTSHVQMFKYMMIKFPSWERFSHFHSL